MPIPADDLPLKLPRKDRKTDEKAKSAKPAPTKSDYKGQPNSPDAEKDHKTDQKAKPAARTPARIVKREPDIQSDTPPASVEAEQGVLSAIMRAPHDAIPKCVAAGLHSSWFYVPAFRTIYDELRDAYDSGDAIDLITFTDRLRGKKLLDSVGGASAVTELQTYLTQIFDYTPTAANLPAYIKIVREMYLRRQIIANAALDTRRAYDPDPAADMCSQLDAITSRTASLRSLHGRNGAQISFRSPKEIQAMPRNPKANFFGDRLLGVARSLVLAGVGGLGKSRMLLQLLVAFILERVWCGIETHNTKGQPWMLVQTQNSTDRLQDDLAALEKYAGDDWRLVEKNLLIHTLETDRDLMINLSDQKNARELESAIRDYNPIGVAFDPLNEIGIGDLSKDVDMTATCNAISHVARAGNPERAIVVAAHAITGVAGMKKAFGFEAAGFGRGSKVLGFWTRAQINAFPATEDYSILGLSCGKLNDGKQFPPFAIRLDHEMIYQHEPDFDMDALREQVEHGKRQAPPIEETLRKLLEQGHKYDKAQIAKLIRKAKGVSQATAYRWVEKAVVMKVLRFNKQIETYELT